MFHSDEIRLLRLSRGIKQEVVAKRMRITKQRYSQLENYGNLSETRINQIITALGYTVETAQKFKESVPPRIL